MKRYQEVRNRGSAGRRITSEYLLRRATCGPSSGSALRAPPNSAALKNASVFGAPELQIPTAVMRQNGVIRHSKQASAGGAPELGILYQWRKLPLSWHLLGKLALD